MDNGNSENHFEEEDFSARKKPRKKKNIPKSKPTTLNDLESPNWQSKNIDSQLYFAVSAIEINLLEIFKVPRLKLSIEEVRYDTTFVYYIENSELGLMGYVGREKNLPNDILYVVKDSARIKWARLEGFLDANDSQLEIVYEKIGVFRRAKSINDFLKFIAGEKSYSLTGNYLVG